MWYDGNYYMVQSKIKNDVERWLTQQGISFEETKSEEYRFHIKLRYADTYGTPTEIFEPAAQLGVIVVGAKVSMKNNQMARYMTYNNEEKNRFENRVTEFCRSIQAICRNITEDGKQKVGVYIVLDDKTGINQQIVLDAIVKINEMHEKTTEFLRKTF